MSLTALPLIAKGDYPAFQRIIPELRQQSYEEWLDDHRKAIAYRRSRNGSVEIPVLPTEFVEWLKEIGKPAGLELLWVFAEKNGAFPNEPFFSRHNHDPLDLD
jgi:hypothetical protein